MHLSLTGVAQVERNGSSPIELPPIDAVMLAWLALEGPTARARMAALLWPDSTEAQARTALRQRLLRLKRMVGIDLTGGGTVTLRLDAHLTHDLADSEALLSDLCLPDAPELDDWLRTQREQRRARARDGLQDQVQRFEDAGQPEAALALAQQLLRMEPLSELAHRRVMRLHYLCGDRAAALAAFDRCEKILKDDVGARPSDETLAVLATIEAQVPAAMPLARRVVPASVLRPPRMVGREREYAQLEQAWAMGHVAAVIGEAGMGKSRLLSEFCEGQPGIVTAAGRPGDAGVPFATLVRLLRAVAERTVISDLSSESRRQLARVLPELGESGAGAEESQRMQLQRALCAYFGAAADLRGMVLDDLHFADAASLEMLQSLIVGDRTGAIRWALAFRPAEAESPLLALRVAITESGQIAPIELAPLDEASLAELVDQLGLGLNGAAIAAQLLQRTGGNPLFVLETLKQAWVEHSLDPLCDGTSLPRPVSVERMIDLRIARLSPPAIALARLASIAAVDFSIGLAESVLNASAIQFADAFNELERAQFLKGTQFVHDLVFEAVLRSVPPAIAEHMHAEVARWLERHDSEPARVAGHWLASATPHLAIEHLLAAAQQSTRGTRWREARVFLEQAARLCAANGRTDIEFDVLTLLHNNYVLNDPGSAHEAVIERMVLLAANPAQRLMAEGARYNLDRRRLHIVPEAQLQDFVDRSERSGDPSLLSSAVSLLISSLINAGRASLAAEVMRRYEGCFAGADTPVKLAEMFGLLSVCLAGQDLCAEAIEHYDRAMVYEKDTGQFEEVMVSMGNKTRVLRMQGRQQAAFSLAQEMDLWHASAEPNRRAWLTSRIGAVDSLRELERYTEALTMMDQHFDEVERHAGAFQPALVLARTATWLGLGQTARAQQTWRAVDPQRVAQAPDWLRARWHFFGVLIGVRLRDGNGIDGATADDLAALDAAAAMAPRNGRRSTWFECCLQRAQWMEPAAGAELADQIDAQATALGMFGFARSARLVAASRRCAVGQVREALLDLERANDLDDEIIPAAMEQAGAQLIACRVLLATHRPAASARLKDAVAALRLRAEQHVPAPFRDSYLHRNPVNRELLALAARHGIGLVSNSRAE